MYNLVVPKNYVPKMSVRETEKAIKFVKDTFQKSFVKNFGFERISLEKSGGSRYFVIVFAILPYKWRR